MPFICTSRDAIVTSPVATDSIASRISFAFFGGRARAVEGNHRGKPCRDRRCRNDFDGAVGVRGSVFRSEDDIRVVREDDRLFGVDRLHRPQQIRSRRVHGLPAFDDRDRA